MSDLLNAITKKPACGCETRYVSQVSKYDDIAKAFFKGRSYDDLDLEDQITVEDIYNEHGE